MRLDVVTVLLLAVNAVNVFTSQRKMALSRPAEATCNGNLVLKNDKKIAKKKKFFVSDCIIKI